MIFEIDDDEMAVTVLRIDHRADIEAAPLRVRRSSCMWARIGTTTSVWSWTSMRILSGVGRRTRPYELTGRSCRPAGGGSDVCAETLGLFVQSWRVSASRRVPSELFQREVMEGEMADHPNVELIRSGYEAFMKGDMDTIDKVFADDINWHISGRNPLAGDRKSKAEVFQFFGKLGELSGGTFNLELHDIVGNDEHVVALVREQGSRAGKTLDALSSHVWHVRNGRATEFWAATYDAHAEDEFWS